MEARVEQFHSDARRPQDARTAKDISKLRQFLFKNQEYRFTEQSKTYLHQAVVLYAGMFEAHAEDNPAMALLQDALAMPFTVFSTAHKKSLLKWLDRLQGGPSSAASGRGGPSKAHAGQERWDGTLIDLSDAMAELMSPDGDTRTVQLAACSPKVLAALRAGWDSGAAVRVRVDGEGTDCVIGSVESL